MSVTGLINNCFDCSLTAVHGNSKNRVLHITRNGNFGGDKPNDTYYQEADIEVVQGVYRLSALDCGGFYNASRLTFEIVSVCPQCVLLRVNNREYTLTPEAPVEITQTDTETSNDGPHFTAYDTLEFRMKEL